MDDTHIKARDTLEYPDYSFSGRFLSFSRLLEVKVGTLAASTTHVDFPKG